jgi:hypothetical protein
MSGNEIRNGPRVFLLLIALAITWASNLRAANYPDHSVKVIVPFPPGGATDIAGRIMPTPRRFGVSPSWVSKGTSSPQEKPIKHTSALAFTLPR